MNTSLRSYACSVLATFVLFGGKSTTRAQSVAPVPTPTIINSAPYTITAAGYYQLGANLNYAGTGASNDAIITINANNVTLDFAGHYIAGPSANAATTLYGIYAYDRANIIIQNGTVSSCYSGVLISGSASDATAKNRNARVLNLTVTKCFFAAVDVENAITPEVVNCRISSIGGTTLSMSDAIGIDLANSTGGKVANCSIANILPASMINSGTAIISATYAVGNEITNCTVGLQSCTKYKDNLTDGVAMPFRGGTAVGDDNN